MTTRIKKTRCSGTKTEAGHKGWIISLLRKGSMYWKPRTDAKTRQRVRKGWYLCEGCKEEVPATLPPIVKGDKRVKNVFVDHIDPVIDNNYGFTGWDSYIDRLFVEVDGFQILCSSCHNTKSQEERAIATERRRREKNASK